MVCIDATLKDLVLRLSPVLAMEVIRNIRECSDSESQLQSTGLGFLKAPEPLAEELSCDQRLVRIKDNMGHMKRLIREGAPNDLYPMLGSTLQDIGICGTPLLAAAASKIFQDVRQVTRGQYFKGEGLALNRKMDELVVMLEHDCFAHSCVIAEPREVPLSINKELEKGGGIQMSLEVR